MNTELLKEIVDYGIIGGLAFIGFLSLWFYLERLMFFKKIDVKNYIYKEKLEIDITNNTSIISSFAANAPYIGLLGTVFGIIITFYTMGTADNIDAKMIMASLALALKATAMGLVVAIPSMLFYNHLGRKIEVILNLWEIDQKSKVAN